MQYLLLIYDNEKEFGAQPKPELDKMMADYNAFTADIQKSGHMVGANRLQSVANATTVRIRAGKTQITDGPFAETREQLGGYFLIEAKTLAEATAIAARMPGAKHGTIEVRPLAPMPGD
jgi:hypothetical protein